MYTGCVCIIQIGWKFWWKIDNRISAAVLFTWSRVFQLKQITSTNEKCGFFQIHSHYDDHHSSTSWLIFCLILFAKSSVWENIFPFIIRKTWKHIDSLHFKLIQAVHSRRHPFQTRNEYGECGSQLLMRKYMITWKLYILKKCFFSAFQICPMFVLLDFARYRGLF